MPLWFFMNEAYKAPRPVASLTPEVDIDSLLSKTKTKQNNPISLKC